MTKSNIGKLFIGMVLLVGGTDGTSNVGPAELFDPATETWTTSGQLREPRINHTANLLPDGTVVVTGGSRDTVPSVLTSTEIYNPATGQWTKSGRLTKRTTRATGTLLQSGEVLVAGGVAPHGITDSAYLGPPSF